MPVELFEGTYGTDATKMIKSEERTYSLESFETPEESLRWEKKSSYPGVLGCFYSHYRLWNKCIELNEPIIIWEDDVVLTRPFIPVAWDDILILSLGFEDYSAPYKHLLTSDSPPIALPYTENHVPGTTGYAITPTGAQKLVNKYRKTFAPSDVAINNRVVNIQIHSNLMGEAIIDKVSLVRNLKFWKE